MEDCLMMGHQKDTVHDKIKAMNMETSIEITESEKHKRKKKPGD